MNSKRLYDEIINRAKMRGLNKKLLCGYFEIHHVVPKCQGGCNDKDNLVLLTAREHYLCHFLLWRAERCNSSLFLAYHKMTFSSNPNQQRKFMLSSKQYEILKRTNSDIKSQQTKGSNNPMYGRKQSEKTLKLIQQNRKPVVYTAELRQKLSAAHKGKHLGPMNPMFGKSPVNAKPVTINGVTYQSANKAAIALNIKPREVIKLLRSL